MRPHLRPVTSTPPSPEERAVAAIDALAHGHAAVFAPNQLLSLSAAQLQIIVDRLDPQAHRLPESVARMLAAAKAGLAAMNQALDAPVIVAPAPGLNVARVD